MTKMTWTQAVEELRRLIENEDAVIIDDGAEDWHIANLVDAIRVHETGEIVDLAVSADGITRIKRDGYLESIPVYRSVKRIVERTIEG